MATPMGKTPGAYNDVQSAPPVNERITVALIPSAVNGLQQLQDRTSLSKTDIVNRAISLYEFIDSQMKAGRDIILQDSQTGETQRIILL